MARGEYKDPEYNKNYYKQNRDKILQQAKEYREDNQEKLKQYRQNNPEIRKNSRLKYEFGITLELYDEMFEKQNGVCDICGLPETKVIRGKIVSLAVDHDHETGKIRGLLCHSCNVSLGGFKDSPELLISAIGYLTQEEDSPLLELVSGGNNDG